MRAPLLRPLPRLVLVLAVAVALAPSAWAGRELQVLGPAEAALRWQPVGAVAAPRWPSGLAPAAGPACIHLGYRIAPDGRTSHFAVLRAWSAAGDAAGDRHAIDAFAQSAAAAVAQWRFAPAARHAPPVYTGTNIAFGVGPAAAGADVRGHCEVADLRRLVDAAQRRVARRGTLLEARMDGKRQADPAMIPYDKHDWFDGKLGP
jgi:hypothetical protein